MGWTEPKTNWTKEDRFNKEDYNRIKNNINVVYEEALKYYPRFDIYPMGADIVSYSDFWRAQDFNTIEMNLDEINKNIYTQAIGVKRTFFDNAPFITWDELNRLENGTKKIKSVLEAQKNAARRIPFRLGNYRGIRV